MPLVYGGLEIHTKHDRDIEIGIQKRIYIISKKKIYITPKLGQTISEVGTIEDNSKTMWMDKRELQNLQQVNEN